MNKLIVLLFFMAVFFMGLVFLGYFKNDLESVQMRMRRLLGKTQEPREVINIERRKSKLPFESFRSWLAQSGFELAPAVFFAGMLALGLVSFTVSFAGFRMSVLVSAGVAGVMLFVPFMMIQMKRKKRLNSFSSVFPDVIARLSSSLRAGYSLQMALEAVVHDGEDATQPIVSQEFGRVLQEMAVGQSFEESLKKMLLRVDTADLRLFITSVTIQRESGGNLVEILDNLEKTIRERFQLRRELDAATSQARFSGLVLILLPVFIALALFFINRQHISFFVDDPVGKKMLWFTFASQMAGVLSIRKIVKMEI